MPFFKTKCAMAMTGKTNACKKPKLEPDEPPPQSMKRCRFGYPKPAECDSLPPLEDEIKCMRPPDPTDGGWRRWAGVCSEVRRRVSPVG